GPWFFRDERLYLFPGDSPMGWRLPLDSLPWVAAGDHPYLIEQDPFAPRGMLPAAASLRAQVQGVTSAGPTPGLRARGAGGAGMGAAYSAGEGGAAADADAAAPGRFESAHWITR
ncbi:transglutaminase family protein, partial [Acinetobacter baumannii]